MFSHMTIKKKLLTGFGVVALITLIAGAAGLYGSIILNADISSISKENLPSVQSLMRIRSEYLETMALQRLLPDYRLGKTKRVQMQKTFAEIKDRLQKGQDIYAAQPKTPDEEMAWSNYLSLQKSRRNWTANSGPWRRNTLRPKTRPCWIRCTT